MKTFLTVQTYDISTNSSRRNLEKTTNNHVSHWVKLGAECSQKICEYGLWTSLFCLNSRDTLDLGLEKTKNNCTVISLTETAIRIWVTILVGMIIFAFSLRKIIRVWINKHLPSHLENLCNTTKLDLKYGCGQTFDLLKKKLQLNSKLQ